MIHIVLNLVLGLSAVHATSAKHCESALLEFFTQDARPVLTVRRFWVSRSDEEVTFALANGETQTFAFDERIAKLGVDRMSADVTRLMQELPDGGHFVVRAASTRQLARVTKVREGTRLTYQLRTPYDILAASVMQDRWQDRASAHLDDGDAVISMHRTVAAEYVAQLLTARLILGEDEYFAAPGPPLITH